MALFLALLGCGEAPLVVGFLGASTCGDLEHPGGPADEQLFVRGLRDRCVAHARALGWDVAIPDTLVAATRAALADGTLDDIDRAALLALEAESAEVPGGVGLGPDRDPAPVTLTVDSLTSSPCGLTTITATAEVSRPGGTPVNVTTGAEEYRTWLREGRATYTWRLRGVHDTPDEVRLATTGGEVRAPFTVPSTPLSVTVADGIATVALAATGCSPAELGVRVRAGDTVTRWPFTVDTPVRAPLGGTDSVTIVLLGPAGRELETQQFVVEDGRARRQATDR